MSLTSFLMIMAFVLFSSFGQLFMKLGLNGDVIPIQKSPFSTVINIVKVMLRPKVAIGLLFYVIGAFIWLNVLKNVQLSIAYPMLSISYFFVVILSVYVLKEKIRWRFAIAGLFFISLGVGLIGMISNK